MSMPIRTRERCDYYYYICKGTVDNVVQVSTDLSGTLPETMVYWGVQDQTRAWWASDLIAEQTSFFTKDTSDNGVEDSEAVFQ